MNLATLEQLARRNPANYFNVSISAIGYNVRIVMAWAGPYPSQALHLGVSNITGGTLLEYDIIPGDVSVEHEIWFNVLATNDFALWRPYFR